MHDKMESPHGLAKALAASLVLHTALVLGIPHFTRSIGNRALHVTIAPVQVTLPKVPEAATKAVSFSPVQQITGTLGTPSTSANPDRTVGRSKGDYEPPALLFVDEIDLEDIQDLTEEGQVELELLITPQGRVAKATLLQTNVPDEFFERVANTFESAEFVPGKVDGAPVATKFRFRVVFSRTSPL